MLFPPEDEVVETEHIEGGHTGHERHPHVGHPVVAEAAAEDFVLREETREGDDAGDGKTADQEGDVGDGHMLAQTVHGGVVVGADGMDESTCAKEEQSLEHGVCEEVEHRCHVAEAVVKLGTGNAERYHHEGNLRDSREGKHALDVDLHAGYHGGVERGESTHNGDDDQSAFLHEVEREETGHKVDTGHNHGGGVDEGRHGSRAFHGVGQPDMQRHHGRLTHTAHKDEHECPCEHRGTHKHRSGRVLEDAADGLGGADVHLVGVGKTLDGHRCKLGEVECAGVERKHQNTHKEAEVGEAGNDECLLGSRYGGGLGVVEADEQIRRCTHELPEDIHLEDVGSDNEAEHREAEERQESVETLEAVLIHAVMVAHIAHRVEVHHEGDGGDDHQHHGRDGVEQEAELDDELLGELEPGLVEDHVLETFAGGVDKFGSTAEEICERGVVRQHQDCAHAEGAERSGEFMAHLHAAQAEEDEHKQRDGKYQNRNCDIHSA